LNAWALIGMQSAHSIDSIRMTGIITGTRFFRAQHCPRLSGMADTDKIGCTLHKVILFYK
jgi:hypothetical protein